MATEELPPTTERPEIVDPGNVPVVFTDWVITGGTYAGVVNLALGAIDHSLKRSPEEPARVIVSARLRCSNQFALTLYNALGTILGLPKPSNALEESDPKHPPKNVIH
jgi:hypothetical protein